MTKKDIYDGDNEFIPIDDYFFNELNEIIKKEVDNKEENSIGLEKIITAKTNKNINQKPDNFLDDILVDKIDFLRQILDEINSQMKDRETLKNKIHDKMDYGICYIQTKLYETDSWGLGRNKEIDTRRSKLEHELEALQKQKRDETRECWRDISNLKKEYRQFFHEYRNALRRAKVILPDKFKK